MLTFLDTFCHLRLPRAWSCIRCSAPYSDATCTRMLTLKYYVACAFPAFLVFTRLATPRDISHYCKRAFARPFLTFLRGKRSGYCHGNEPAEGDQHGNLHLLSSSFVLSESQATGEVSGRLAHFYSSIMTTCPPCYALIKLCRICRSTSR